MGGSRGDMDRETQQVDHEWHVDDTAADAKDAGEEADDETGDDTNPLVVVEICRQIQQVYWRFMCGVPVHDAGHDEQKQTEIQIQHRATEGINDIGTEEGAWQGSQGKGDGSLEVNPALTDIGQCAREGIGEYHDQ